MEYLSQELLVVLGKSLFSSFYYKKKKKKSTKVEYYLNINTVTVLARGCTGSLQGFCLAHHICVCHVKGQISVCGGSVWVYGGFPRSLPQHFPLGETMWICRGTGDGGLHTACSASWGQTRGGQAQKRMQHMQHT